MITQVTMYLNGFWSFVRLARQDSTTPFVHWFTLACWGGGEGGEEEEKEEQRRKGGGAGVEERRCHHVAVAPYSRLYRLLNHVRHLVHDELSLLCGLVTHPVCNIWGEV